MKNLFFLQLSELKIYDVVVIAIFLVKYTMRDVELSSFALKSLNFLQGYRYECDFCLLKTVKCRT